MVEVGENHQEVPVASVYKMLLFKLYRYHLNELSRQDDMTNDMEWNDIPGMLKVQGLSLDLSLLKQAVKLTHWADSPGIKDSLEKLSTTLAYSD